MIAVGILVMITSAGAYSFGLYSQKLKSVLNINQEQMNLVANFKDLGVNLGIPAGLLYDFWSPGGVLLVGSVQGTLGYTLSWLALTKRISPSLWQMCLFLFIGANSQPMFNTAVLVQAVKMFPSSRGIIISLMKGYIGISGAILIQVFVAIEGSKNSEAFLLLLVWLPSTVALVSIFFIRSNVKPFQGLPDSKYFYAYLALGFALAFYLMGVNVASNLTKMSKNAERLVGAGMLVLLVIPLLIITYSSEIHGKQSLNAVEGQDDVEAADNEQKKVVSEPLSTVGDVMLQESNGLQSRQELHTGNQIVDEGKLAADLYASGAGKELEDNSSLGADTDREQIHTKKAWPKRGEDHTIREALTSLDFWILFVATIFGVGSGLTATDNMGQLGLSLGYPPTNVKTFVSLLSIWNSIGRWVGGFLSDYLLFRYGFPRTQFYTIALLMMAVAYVLLAVNVPACLYYGSILLGMSFGTLFPVYTTIVAEEFGLKRFATLYNCLNISSSVGNYILSGPVAGKFYDAEARKQADRLNLGGNSVLICDGSVCFRRTCFTLMGVSIGAATLAGLLWYRTKHFYTEMHKDFQKSKSCELAQRANHEDSWVGSSEKRN